jgi:hypothetical protein
MEMGGVPPQKESIMPEREEDSGREPAKEERDPRKREPERGDYSTRGDWGRQGSWGTFGNRPDFERETN